MINPASWTACSSFPATRPPVQARFGLVDENRESDDEQSGGTIIVD